MARRQGEIGKAGVPWGPGVREGKLAEGLGHCWQEKGDRMLG